MLSHSALEKKRQFATERAARLTDPRMRVMGIDRAALDEQIKEKEATAKVEKERNDFFDTQAMLMDKHAQVLQREVDEVRRTREREIKEFRDTFQKRDASREWDLNNPKRVVSSLPGRVADDDPRCGPSSLQKFEGEDLDFKNRKQAQQEQLRRWASQQTDEKLMKKWNEKEGNQLFEDRAEEMAFRTWQIEQEIAQQRRQMATTTAEFNKQLAEQKRREKLLNRMNQTQKNLEEIENMMNSDILNETTPQMAPGAATTKSDRFKGLTDSQREEIRRMQDEQRAQMAAKRSEDAEEARQWAQQEAMENRMGTALDRQRARERREQAIELGKERQRQAAEAASRRASLNEQYRNQIGEEYFVWGKGL